jgi:hypothetical protein
LPALGPPSATLAAVPIRRILLWTALAFVGLLVAVAVTTAATSLTSQRVGLQAEPLDAGESLAPRRTRTPEPTPTPEPARTPEPTATADPTPAPTESGDDDDGGGSDDHGGRGRGRGGDDD